MRNPAYLRMLVRRYGNLGYMLAGTCLLALWLWKQRRMALSLGAGALALAVLFVVGHEHERPSVSAQYTIADLGTLPKAVQSEAHGLNDSGQVVGSCEFSNGVRHAFVWQNDKMVDLHKRSERNSEAAAINKKGWFGEDAYTSSRPCLWQGKRIRDLGTVAQCAFGNALSINDKGQIVGISYNLTLRRRALLRSHPDGIIHSWTNNFSTSTRIT